MLQAGFAAATSCRDTQASSKAGSTARGLVIKPGTERNEMERNEMEKIVKSVYSNETSGLSLRLY